MAQSIATFDFIVVGAGTAGCALAARLSEDAAVSVCLLEAGGMDAHPFIRIPAAVLAAIGRHSLNWGFETSPQAALHDRRIPIPRGHVLGGVVTVETECHFQLVGRLRREPRDPNFVEPLERVVQAFQSRDTVLD